VDEMAEIVEEFLVESHENLDQLDRDLVALEREPGSRELLSSIFRTIHTIKGTSGFLAFGRLEKLTHAGESLLSRLRDGTQSMTPQSAGALLRMVDAVRVLLDQIEASGAEGEVEIEEVIAAVTSCIEDAAAPAATRTAAPVPPKPAPPEPVPTKPVPPKPAPKPVPPKPVPPKPARGRGRKAAPEVAPASGTPTGPERLAELAAPQSPAVPEPSPEPEPEQVFQTSAEPPAADLPAEAAQAEATPAKRALSESSIRVDVDLLDALMRLVGELVLTRNQVLRSVSEVSHPGLVRTTQRLNLITSELQESVMKTRMQPIEHIWSKLPRVIRDLSTAMGKKIRLAMVGAETELDRSLLEAVKDPLTHLVRNAVDHGIETPQERQAAGKSPEGTLTLRAYHEGGHVVVEISDDGAGVDPVKVAATALRRGLVTQDELTRTSERDLVNLIFLPGFSTAAAVTNVSGRGVGMDVVKTNIERIGGTVDVESVVGKGTTWRLTIPLTLAIIQALTVECGGQRYVIPQVGVHELVYLDSQNGAKVEYVSGAPVYRLRGRLLPLVRLDEMLGLPIGDSAHGSYVAVLQVEGRRFGLVVDRVLNTDEIVVKPLSSRLKDIGVYAGATILGDGAVALILDVTSLARRASLAVDAVQRTEPADGGAEAVSAQTTGRLLITGVGDRRVAIPLDMVTRLEEFAADRIERIGSREVVQYRGKILPLLRLADLLGVVPSSYAGYGMEDPATDGAGPAGVPAVVYTLDGRSVALAVERIEDIVDDELSARSDLDAAGVSGSAVIHDKVTELLDVRQAILAADPRFYAEAADPAPFVEPFDQYSELAGV
jgi:two-component system, chemotaxis family, sensor kinase CheA